MIQLKADVQLKSSETYQMFKAKSYKQQVVDGMMYYVKVYFFHLVHIELFPVS